MHEIEDYSLNELKLDKVVNKFLENWSFKLNKALYIHLKTAYNII